nr:S1/P1 nuclease [uncultured Roseateles sp.]
MRASLASFAALCGLLFGASPAAAWGPSGHASVGAIADQLIAGTPTAKKVRAILGSNLQTAAGWADCARSVESSGGVWSYVKPGTWPSCKLYENPDSQAALIAFVKRNASRCGGNAGPLCRHKSYHFVDLSLPHTHYDPALPGAGPTDLVHAINASLAVLEGGKSPAPFDLRGQREALRLLTHYLGDIHQPLHVGSIYLDDAGQALDPATEKEAHDHSNAGGNSIMVGSSKLHGLWDDVSDKLLKQMVSGPGLAEARAVPATPGAMAEWAAGWAGETVVQAGKAFKDLKFGAKHPGSMGAEWPATATDPNYRQTREALQHEQLVKAGARLAQILTTLFP